MKARWSCGEFSAKYYHDPPLALLIDFDELSSWSFHRAIIAEFITTLLFLYITVLTNIGYKSQIDPAHGGDQCGSVGILAWASGGMISILVYCTAAIAGGHIKPAVTFGLFLGRKVSLIRAAMYMVAQCLGAICGVGLVKAFQKTYYNQYGGKGNELAPGYNKGVGMGGAEIIGTFVLVYTVFSATDPERSARDSHVPVLFWLHFPLDLLFPWFTLPPSPLLELASTLLGALELLSSTTKTSPGMTIEFSGLDHSLELPLLHSTTSTF